MKERFRTPPGMIVVATGELIRSTNFAAAISRTVALVPEVENVMWSIGASVADNLNDGMRALLEQKELGWVFTIGDDHDWQVPLLPEMLKRMYKRDYDILAPLCFRRSWPPAFVAYDRQDEEGVWWPTDADEIFQIISSDYPTREVGAAGNAAMLIRRRVIEKMDDPWWRNGLEGPNGITISQSGEDINFCEDAKAKGFKIHVAFDLPLVHIANVGLIPAVEDGSFGMRLIFGTTVGPFYPLATGKRDGDES